MTTTAIGARLTNELRAQFATLRLDRRLAVSVALAVLVAGCAINRPHVKSLRDREAHQIQFDVPIHTTVKALNAIPAHCGPASDRRVHREEFQVYEVIGRIIRVKRESDQDIHVVLEDPDDPREHLVAESDDPGFRGNAASPYREKLEAARRMFDELQRQSGAHELKDLRGIVVRVTGVGFFDVNHLQVGRSRSCIELHPILAIEQIKDTHGPGRPRPHPAKRSRGLNGRTAGSLVPAVRATRVDPIIVPEDE